MKRAATTSSSTKTPKKRHQTLGGDGGAGLSGTTTAAAAAGGHDKEKNIKTKTPEIIIEGRERDHERERDTGRLKSTPLLNALSFVMKSGFLYKHEAIVASSACQDFQTVYNDVEDEIPRHVEVKLSVDSKKKNKKNGSNNDDVAFIWPDWVTFRQLEDVIPTVAFSKKIVEKVIDLKVAAKPTQRQQQKARESLPKWGVDIHQVSVHVWGPNNRNSGGIAIRLFTKLPFNPIFKYHQQSNQLSEIRGSLVRLDRDLRLWTGIRCWRVYDGELYM